MSGHGPQNPDGSLALPLGKLGRELGVDEEHRAARLTALSLGPDSGALRPDAGKHSRSAVGMAELPFNMAVEIEAEVEIEG